MTAVSGLIRHVLACRVILQLSTWKLYGYIIMYVLRLKYNIYETNTG